MKQIPSPDPTERGGKALCVQDIDSPLPDVWNQILSFNSYVGKVPKLKTSEIYEQKEMEGNKKSIKVKMVIGVLPGYKVSEGRGRRDGANDGRLERSDSSILPSTITNPRMSSSVR